MEVHTAGLGEQWDVGGQDGSGSANMEMTLVWFGRLAGVGGAVLCVVAVLLRLGGTYYLGEIPVGQVFQVGMAAMLAGCLGLLGAIYERVNR